MVVPKGIHDMPVNYPCGLARKASTSRNVVLGALIGSKRYRDNRKIGIKFCLDGRSGARRLDVSAFRHFGY